MLTSKPIRFQKPYRFWVLTIFLSTPATNCSPFPLSSWQNFCRLPLSEDQILALAPDEPSKKAGKDLAGAAKWVSKGGNDTALWGECQGSGSKPYQTQVDLANIAFKCSCPSRKFPCKHGLGLLLYNARQPKDFTVTQMPAWV